jgi:hypothetical protein
MKSMRCLGAVAWELSIKAGSAAFIASLRSKFFGRDWKPATPISQSASSARPGPWLAFVMDFVEGADVQKLLAAQGRLPMEKALSIIAHVLDALTYAHQQGIIHRDIKPANIMVDDAGHVQIADFGIARSTASDTSALTNSHVAMGTPDFMAPEAHLGMDQVDHRADLYAVGVTLYQIVTGKLPRGRFVAPSLVVPGLDKRLDRILDRALQPDRDARYSSAVEMRADLEKIRPPSASAASPNLRVALWTGGAALLLALVGVSLHIARTTPQRPIAVSTSDLNPAPVSVLEPGATRLWDGPEKLPARRSIRWENNALKLNNAHLVTTGLINRDAIIRASIRADANSGSQGLALRMHADEREYYKVGLDLRNKSVKLYSIHDKDGGAPLSVWPMPRAYAPDQWLRLELRIIGDAITVSLDGQPLGTVHERSQTEAGNAAVFASESGYFRDIVYVPLDMIPLDKAPERPSTVPAVGDPSESTPKRTVPNAAEKIP